MMCPPVSPNTENSSKVNQKTSLLDSIHSHDNGVPCDRSDDQFDQYVSTSYDEDDENFNNDNQLSLQSKSTDNIQIEEKADDRTLKMSQSMPEIGRIDGLKSILKKSSSTKGSTRRKQSSSTLTAITESTSMAELIDGSGSSLSSSQTLSSTPSNDCTTVRITSSLAISTETPAIEASNETAPLISRTCSMPEIARNVSFKSVEIREYEITLVDNPACRHGPPIGLSWKYIQGDTEDFFDYEFARSNNRRKARQMILPKNYRKQMLKAHTTEEIKEVKKEIKKIKSSRNRTILFGSMFEVKEALEDASRSIKKKMKSKKCDDKSWRSSHI